MGETMPARLCNERQLVLAQLERDSALSAQSRSMFVDLSARFLAFLNSGASAVDLAAVDAATVKAFVLAPTSAGEPSVATMHLRRSALRMVFRVARELGLADGDPSLDLALPARSPLATRPLTDDEVVLCRSASLRSLEETRLPAAWALAECGVRSSELGKVTVADLRLGENQVWIRGSSRTLARFSRPSDWGVRQLERRVRSTKAVADQSLLYSGRFGSEYHRQAASCVAISAVLRLAGLASESDVRPLSVPGWAGRQVLAETGRIEEVAKALGVGSLDRAARLIAWDWTETPRVGE